MFEMTLEHEFNLHFLLLLFWKITIKMKYRAFNTQLCNINQRQQPVFASSWGHLSESAVLTESEHSTLSRFSTSLTFMAFTNRLGNFSTEGFLRSWKIPTFSATSPTDLIYLSTRTMNSEVVHVQLKVQLDEKYYILFNKVNYIECLFSLCCSISGVRQPNG